MTEQESDELINVTASKLEIAGILTEEYRRDLYQESDGHPYVIKVLLGEVAKAGRPVKVERIVASKDEILDALFERTYAGLSPGAKRVFLTICNWRSTLPQLAIEAILLRPANEKMDVSGALDELLRSSFIEMSKSKEDNEIFITVPLTASVFGKRKLEVSPIKIAVEADTQLLYDFGAAQQADIVHGVAPRINRFFSHIARKAAQSEEKLNHNLPILEFLCRRYYRAWPLLASLYEELASPDALEKAKEALRRYIESTGDGSEKSQAWERLSSLCQRTKDSLGEAHALVELSQVPGISFVVISNNANKLNHMLRTHSLSIDSQEKQILVNKVIEVMETRIKEGDATDCSRLAWLFMHLQDKEKAKQYVELGLSIEHDNYYCQNLAERLLIA